MSQATKNKVILRTRYFLLIGWKIINSLKLCNRIIKEHEYICATIIVKFIVVPIPKNQSQY